MIGLALVTLVATLAGSVVQTFTGAVDEIFVGELRDHGPEQLLADPDRRRRCGGEGARRDRRRQRAHGRGARLRLGRVRNCRRPGRVEGDQPRLGRGLERRSSASSAADGAFVDEDFAKKHDLEVGSPVEITFANGTTA